MSVRAVETYEFPSRSRQELYGDDQLVHVWWRNNMMFCAAATFRAPQAMPWADFKAGMIDPWASSDPDYDPSTPGQWTVDDVPVVPDDARTLAELGVGHKSVISFQA